MLSSALLLSRPLLCVLRACCSSDSANSVESTIVFRRLLEREGYFRSRYSNATVGGEKRTANFRGWMRRVEGEGALEAEAEEVEEEGERGGDAADRGEEDRPMPALLMLLAPSAPSLTLLSGLLPPAALLGLMLAMLSEALPLEVEGRLGPPRPRGTSEPRPRPNHRRRKTTDRHAHTYSEKERTQTEAGMVCVCTRVLPILSAPLSSSREVDLVSAVPSLLPCVCGDRVLLL